MLQRAECGGDPLPPSLTETGLHLAVGGPIHSTQDRTALGSGADPPRRKGDITECRSTGGRKVEMLVS